MTCSVNVFFAFLRTKETVVEFIHTLFTIIDQSAVGKYKRLKVKDYYNIVVHVAVIVELSSRTKWWRGLGTIVGSRPGTELMKYFKMSSNSTYEKSMLLYALIYVYDVIIVSCCVHSAHNAFNFYFYSH